MFSLHKNAWLLFAYYIPYAMIGASSKKKFIVVNQSKIKLEDFYKKVDAKETKKPTFNFSSKPTPSSTMKPSILPPSVTKKPAAVTTTTAPTSKKRAMPIFAVNSIPTWLA